MMLTRQVFRSLKHPKVPLMDKIIYTIFTLSYVLVPIDILPMFPVDDFFVAWLASVIFVRFANKHIGRTSTFDDGDVVDVEGDIIED